MWGKKLAGDYTRKAATYLQESREKSAIRGLLTRKTPESCLCYMVSHRENFNPGRVWNNGAPQRGRSLPRFVALRVALQFLLQQFPQALFFQFAHFSVVGALQFVDLRA